MIKKIKQVLKDEREIVLLVISGIALGLSLLHISPLPFDMAWIAIILCGVPIIMEAVIGLVTKFDIKADVLVSLALIASIYIGEDFAAGEVAFIMQIGALLEERTVAKARAGIEKLIHLTPQTARIIKNDVERIVSAEKVKIDDLLRILPGEMIPVDGIIIKGQTSVNQAVMTGESLPVDKSEGDEVSSGTVNQFGTFDMKATKVGADSSIQRMIKLVQSTDAGKAKIVGMADRWATWIVVIALVSAVLTWIVTGEIIRAVTILVVFCPCALVLATPTAIVAAIGNVTKHGFLVQQGDALERLASIRKITFDKTGTLTVGSPKITTIYSFSPDYSKEKVHFLTASLEQYSEHPLGKAIVSSYKGSLASVENFEMLVGYGVCGTIDQKQLLVGNRKLLEAHQIKITDNIAQIEMQYLMQGSTIIFVAIEKTIIGLIILSDTLRTESKNMIEQIKQLSVQPVLLTGDYQNTAHTIANQLDIAEVYPECLPEDKLHIIDTFQQNNESVCMIGDGINDAPALKKSTVGIAMGGIGSDIAVDAADIVLIEDDIKELPHLFALSRKMMLTIKCNLSFSMGLNFLAIILAMTGILNPIVGALVHNAGSVLVILNSALLLRWKYQKLN